MPEQDLIAEAITEAFGERCPDVAEGCLCCDAWKQYDISVARLKGADNHAVKALVWGDRIQNLTRSSDLIADSVCGQYVIGSLACGDRFRLRVPDPDYIYVTNYDSLEAAQSAAQADFERRILSALLSHKDNAE